LNFQHLHWQESVDDGLRAIELADGDEYTFSDRFRVVDTLLRMATLMRPVLMLWNTCGAERRSGGPHGGVLVSD